MSSDPQNKAVKIAAFVSVALVVIAFTSGAGIASIVTKFSRNDLMSIPAGSHTIAFDQSKSTLIRSEKILPPTLRVELIRGGDVLCSSMETPTINTSKSFTEYTLSQPIVGCPDVQKGDIVKAVWTFRNEVEVSSR